MTQKDDGFIVLSLHRAEIAEKLSQVLESHGIVTETEEVITGDETKETNTREGGKTTIRRLKIKETDILKAVNISESVEASTAITYENLGNGNDGILLIPVDFKPHSLQACKVGFELAKRLSLSPVLLHAYMTPYFNLNVGFENSLDGGLDQTMSEELNEIEIGKDLREESIIKMRELRKTIEQEQNKGRIERISFSTILKEGIAEDVIREYCRLTPPAMIVMATRGKQKKDEELIGSVTAEVLDSCAVPIYSTPEQGHLESLASIKRIVFFCNLDRNDLTSMDRFMRMFDFPEVEVTLIPIPERSQKDVKNKADQLKDYFNKTYAESHFKTAVFPMKNLMEDFKNYESQAGIEMIIVPNKKRNIISRLLNPGIAHKILFERDLPLLALPVANRKSRL